MRKQLTDIYPRYINKPLEQSRTSMDFRQ